MTMDTAAKAGPGQAGGGTPDARGNPAYVPDARAKEEGINLQLDKGRRARDAAGQATAGQFACARIIGQVQAFEAVNQFSAVARVVLLRQMKESRAYKNLPVPQPDGSVRMVKTFDELCGLMGMSRSKVDEDIQNLAALGEAFMAAAGEMGLSYRQLRRLRALPDEDRELVMEGQRLGEDPEALKDLIEELAAKRDKDRQALREAGAALEAKDNVLMHKNRALDAAQTELARLRTLPPDQEAALRSEKETAALRELHACGLSLLGIFGKYLSVARGILSAPEGGYHLKERAATLTSGLCSQMAEELLEAGMDIDFRQLTYPAHLGDLPQRGDDRPAEKGARACTHPTRSI